VSLSDSWLFRAPADNPLCVSSNRIIVDDEDSGCSSATPRHHAPSEHSIGSSSHLPDIGPRNAGCTGLVFGCSPASPSPHAPSGHSVGIPGPQPDMRAWDVGYTGVEYGRLTSVFPFRHPPRSLPRPTLIGPPLRSSFPGGALSRVCVSPRRLARVRNQRVRRPLAAADCSSVGGWLPPSLPFGVVLVLFLGCVSP